MSNPKTARGLKARIKEWDEMRADPGSTTRTKIVSGAAYHCPGSQNVKKSGTGHRSILH